MTKEKIIRTARNTRRRLPAPCSATATIPKNKLGYFAAHDADGLSKESMLKMIDGPLTAMQPKLTEELSKKE